MHSSEDFRVVSEGWATVPKCFRNIQTVSDSVIIASYAVSDSFLFQKVSALYHMRFQTVSESFRIFQTMSLLYHMKFLNVSGSFIKFQNVCNPVSCARTRSSASFAALGIFGETETSASTTQVV